MLRENINGLNLWQFALLKNKQGIKHFVTERTSSGHQREFTLSYSSGPDREEIEANRNQLASTLGIEDNKLFFPSQVHKSQIVRVGAGTTKDGLMETDALITNERGICIAVMAADCVPILLYDTKNKAIGAVHSGWRGTVAKILEKTLLEMNYSFGTKGEDVLAGIGPSICQESYEVGEEVVNEVKNAFGDQSGLVKYEPGIKAKVDLWQANKLQLLSFGVKEANIEVSSLCTVLENRYFFSARKGDKGRLAAGIMLN